MTEGQVRVDRKRISQNRSSPVAQKMGSLIGFTLGDGKLFGIDEFGGPDQVVDSFELNLNTYQPTFPVNDNVIQSFRKVALEPIDLSQSFLEKYFSPEYPKTMEKMDKIEIWKVLNGILKVFSKLDGLWTTNSINLLEFNLKTSIENIIQDGVSLLCASHVGLYLIDPETDEMVDWADERDTCHKFAPGFGIVGYSVAIGMLINCRDPIEQGEIYEEDIDSFEKDPPQSLMCLPIFGSENKVIGVIKAANKLNDEGDITYFGEEDEYLFKALGSMAGTILCNVKMYTATAETQKKIEVLLATTRSLGSILHIDKLIKNIMESAKELLNVDRCTFFLDDPERKKLKAVIQGRDSVQTISIPYTAGIAGAVFSTGTHINITDAYRDERFNPEVDKQTGYVTRTILCMPIKNIRGECIGVTQMINKRKGVFSLEDESMLSSFSAQAAVALEKSQLFQKTEEMRNYLQAILSSITSCVITLTDSMKLVR